MSDKLSPKQTLIVWCLLAKHGEAPQRDIIPKIEKKDRESLIIRRLVSATKGKRGAIYLRLEDKGWEWANEHLLDDLPRNYRVLGDWLARLQRFLNETDHTVADIIGTPPPCLLTPSEVRARLEEAYLVVTGGQKGTGASLAKIRAALPDLDRATVDASLLRILQGDKKARLGQLSDPKALTKADKDAAFAPGGEPFHLLWIQK
ncbi:MAG: hypothetical protein H3C55_15240 [Pseudorhodoplanes sp.]|nr:hypothetical protein [Pseudorhodoplanes sp.]MBW7950684.1 hypothetical protein [Pseudorhodoplanes sp.]